MKRITLFFIYLIVAKLIFSQNEIDALRYTYLLPIGTARYLGLAGAYNSTGADLSMISINPAGLAQYKKSEFSFTPAFNFTFTQSSYLKKEGKDNLFSLKLPNIGLVFVKNESEDAKWTRWQMAFAFNTLANFNHSIFIHGNNATSSIVDVFYALANGTPYTKLNPFDTKLAFDTYLIDTLGGSSSYTKAVEGGLLQERSIFTRGYLNEFAVAMSGSYKGKIYLGASLGVPYICYNEENYYSEVDDADTLAHFKSLKVNNFLTTKGTGINLKLGLIYIINNYMRWGLSMQTPTAFYLKDNFHTIVQSNLETTSYESSSPTGINTYTLTTPFRMESGLTLLYPEIGLLSFACELVNYNQARLRDAGNPFSEANEAIATYYRQTFNYKGGVEILLAPFALRAGYAYFSSPYNNNLNDGSTQVFSGGFRYQEANYYVDVTYSYQKQKENFYMYDPQVLEKIGKSIEPTSLKHNQHYFLFTLGIKLD